MADWPDLDELKLVLNVTHDAWDATLARNLAAAITKVKLDTGAWDDLVDTPDDSLSAAALRMAELLSLRPDAAAEAMRDPTYQRLLYGHRRAFGIA